MKKRLTVDILFDKMEEIYKDKWRDLFLPTDHVSREIKIQNFKKMWVNGLKGTRQSEVQQTLLYYKSRGYQHSMPTIVEFFKYCKYIRKLCRNYARN